MIFSAEKIIKGVVKHLLPFLKEREGPEPREREWSDFQKLLWSYGTQHVAHFHLHNSVESQQGKEGGAVSSQSKRFPECNGQIYISLIKKMRDPVNVLLRNEFMSFFIYS